MSTIRDKITAFFDEVEATAGDVDGAILILQHDPDGTQSRTIINMASGDIAFGALLLQKAALGQDEDDDT